MAYSFGFVELIRTVAAVRGSETIESPVGSQKNLVAYDHGRRTKVSPIACQHILSELLEDWLRREDDGPGSTRGGE